MIKDRADKLSPTEEGILKYIIANETAARTMSIRKLASACYVSTATILRFVRKLGFSGYQAFQEKIDQIGTNHIEEVISQNALEDHNRNRYLKNLIETVKMVSSDKVEAFDNIMSRNPKVYILSEEFSSAVAEYLYQLLDTLGYEVEIPRTEYELKSAEQRISRNDVLLVLSSSNNNQKLISQLELFITVASPTTISITQASDSVVQNMSDLNFRVYADELKCDDGEVTSRCGMIAIMEILLNKQIKAHQVCLQ